MHTWFGILKKKGAIALFVFFFLKKFIKTINGKNAVSLPSIPIFLKPSPTFLFLFKHINEAKINKTKIISLLRPSLLSRTETETEETSPPMGCFAGCFGLSSNTKRRNSTRKILPRHQVTFFSSGKITLSCSSLSNICFLQRICSYEPLLSSDPSDSIANVDSPENILSSNLRSVFFLPIYRFRFTHKDDTFYALRLSN